MRTFLLTVFGIAILYRGFGDPRTCLTILFWRWILGGLDSSPCPSACRTDRTMTMDPAPIDPASFALAEKRAVWEHRFDLLEHAVALLAA
jgi:hypothetical protein